MVISRVVLSLSPASFAIAQNARLETHSEIKAETRTENNADFATIKYDTAGHVKVFTMLGQEVATLVQQDQEAGYHEVRFDGSVLASGVYIYRLKADSFVESRKLLLLR